MLVGAVRPEELEGLKALKPEHHGGPWIYGSLSTLAMGDTQAVELAQSCHLGLGLQYNVVTSDNLSTMYKPLPSSRTMCGLIIDDFITMSQVPADQSSCEPSEAAKLADQMQEVYESVHLVPNKAKAFRDETQSSFWGADIDGEKGIIRGSWKRAIPLAGLMLRLSKIGYATGNLLRILVGSLISLYLFRRRFLALPDSLLEGSQKANPDAIFKLSGRQKSDLLIAAVLLPWAATNLRAKTPEVIAASDASNWGEAGVCARVPKLIGKELLPHTLRKSIWARLLSPAAAWMRAKDLLEAEDELPDPSEAYKANPLWTLLARRLKYRLLFENQKSGQRRINVGELRAGLKTERILGARKPSSRVILGLNSRNRRSMLNSPDPFQSCWP